MRLIHVSFPFGMAPHSSQGQLGRSLTTQGGYEMTYLSRLQLIEINRPEWEQPVYVPVGAVESLTPEEPLKKT